ncbi:MAG: hypothetical protein JWM87_134 [Candidatus Eremiobacteraeota bacterium]|jgi:hypothetical protein|nr:hypothetical protein [Candidatus Eremiobacteraeota bacterium]
MATVHFFTSLVNVLTTLVHNLPALPPMNG